ncbi:MAG: glycosyltransferase [Micropruina sp.]|uniref:glycosyltransferase n=1 Tax=Micropruina sp. TaxID=2737536 RepID=UPI0039E400FB
MARFATAPNARLAGWAPGLRLLGTETNRSRLSAHLGVLLSITAIVVYGTWRILFTMPLGGWNLVAAWALVAFEVLPVVGLVVRARNLWNLDCSGPEPVTTVEPGLRAAVFIPTYNEPVEVIAPTIAAAVALEPAHQTWVLDDGDRPWVRELCESYGARYVRRDQHTHAKAGNMNHALELMAVEVAAGAEPIDVIGVLDCDHVPLPHFLTATLGWFRDPEVALVQAPQTYYNSGAFDDDGDTGEQGVFFHVQLPARDHAGEGSSWCGSTSLIRVSALQDIGGIATDTIVEDLHTTMLLVRAGWKTAYHHQVLALGLAPATPEQYLLQRRRWGLGCMQVLVRERLWAAKRWLSWRGYYEYLDATVWWLEGVATVAGFLIPVIVLLSGAHVSTADPWVFMAVFTVLFVIRLWGARRLYRLHLHWGSAFALRILRIPVGLACLWWLLTRRTLEFAVTPKAGSDERRRGHVPQILWWLLGLIVAVVLYAGLGVAGVVPWQTSPSSTVTAGAWVVLAGVVLLMGIRRIQSAQFATSRRNAYRVEVHAPISINGAEGQLLDVSMGGVALSVPAGVLPPASEIELVLPGQTEPILLETVRVRSEGATEIASFRVRFGDWEAYRAIGLWLFHTPSGVIQGLPDAVPVVALRNGPRSTRVQTLVAQYGVSAGSPVLDG